MKNNPKIYIVLPVHNRINITRKFIDRLKGQTYKDYHLILVDDGSTDGTAEYVGEQIENLTVLRGSGNLWWAGALTKAYGHLSKVKARDDDLVWINNDDSVFDPDYFERVVNDPDLAAGSLIISPGHDINSDFIERGFSIHWPTLQFKKLQAGEEPDAITTRGLYMYFLTYKSLGPLHPVLLPQYLSDLEYTYRAKRRGCKLIISKCSHVYVDRSSTGMHVDNSKTLRELFYNHFVSRKTAYSTLYWGNMVLLAAPREYKLKAFLLVYKNFIRRLARLCREKKQPPALKRNEAKPSIRNGSKQGKLISVVITSYNQREYLREAIESVVNQTFLPCEILVCDDASKDGSQELIKEYEKQYPGLVKGIFHELNLGISGNRSSGLERARGELVTWVDGDDRYKPEKLETELTALLKDPGAGWAYSQVDIIDAGGNRKGARYNSPPAGYILDVLVTMLGSAPRNQMVYLEALKKISFFRHDMTLYEDFDLCLRLAKNYKAVYCPEPQVEYRIHPGGVHNISKQNHIDNYRKLFGNFRMMISDLPVDRRIVLERKLSDRINFIAGQDVGLIN
ncbi:MAG: glycosyltransferase [Nitrospirae bacterium]|nr:glycosyltransferase [Nitrospirota bacterium]